MSKTLRTTLILSLILVLSGCEDMFQKTVTIHGIVVIEGTDIPVSGLTVYCETYYMMETWLFGHGFTPKSRDYAKLETDENGKFTAVLN